MASIHDYEIWLDDLDKRLTVSGDQIVGKFSISFFIPLKSCSTPSSALYQARRLSLFLIEEEDVHISYLAKRLIKLAARHNKFEADPEELYKNNELIRVDMPSCDFNDSDDKSKQLYFWRRESEYLKFNFHMSKDSRPSSLEITRRLSSMDCLQSATTKAIGVASTKNYLVYYLPSDTAWSQYFDINKYQGFFLEALTAPRFAVRHSLQGKNLEWVQNFNRLLVEELETVQFETGYST